MSPLLALMSQLEDLGVRLWAEGERLRFRAPEGVVTPELRDALRARKGEILAFLGHDGKAGWMPPLGRRPRGEVPCLSFAQQRLWFLDRLGGPGAAYNEASALRLEGPLDLRALRNGFERVTARHEALRTRFPAVDGAPKAVVEPWPKIDFCLVDLSALASAAGSRQRAALLTEEAAQPFDLANGPLVRIRLLRLAPAHHVLAVTLHHIVSDGWSSAVFIRELAAFYGAHLRGERAALPALAVQYADFAHWQRQWFRGDVLMGQLAFWQEQLAAAPRVLALPADRPRPARPSGRGGTVRFALPASTAHASRQLLQANGATLFMGLLAGFAALLHRHSGQHRLVLGTVVANRRLQQLEPLIGFFVNTLALPLDVGGQPGFQALLAGVRKIAVGAFENQDVPFEQVVEALGVERSPRHAPLFQVMFVLENAPRQELALPGLTVTPLPVAAAGAKFDLTLLVEEKEDALTGIFEYSADVFDRTTVVRWAGHYQRLLQGLVAEPQKPLAAVPLLGAAERHQLAVEWAGGDTDYPRDQGLAGLFAARAALTPSALAVVSAAASLTYGELARRAASLARRLRQRGVGAGTPVGICLERGEELIIGLLGIVTAGGVYVPLDPAYPRPRLDFMLRDAGVGLVVGRPGVGPAWPAGVQQIAPVADGDGGGQLRPGPGRGDALAYITYTSGSTGRPKGVRITHRGVIRLVHGFGRSAFEADDTFLQLAPLPFDASTFEVWSCLLNGGRLVMMAAGELDLVALGATLRCQRVSVLFLTTGLCHLMLEERPRDLRGVRMLVAGGEALSLPHALRARRLLFDTRFVNGYGPTENTTFSTSFTVPRRGELGASVPIGRPLANAQAWVLDRSGRPAPIGVPGELYVGGDGLAAGYHRRPGLTASRFVPGVPGGRPGGRLYRTGDRVRTLAAGQLEFLGRLDDQVKIRGFRIEPGEVESQLLAHEQVREAVLLARPEGEAGGLRLLAWVGVWDATSATAEALRSHLAQRLPAHMLPASIVVLAALPRTPSGKVDRHALPSPAKSDGAADAAAAPPNATEELLTGLWADLLGCTAVSRDDDFFVLGGHSLLATRLTARIRQVFGVELAVRSVFEAPTPARLAPLVEAAQRGPATPLPPLVPVPRHRPLPLSFSQQRLWFLDQLEGAGEAYQVAAGLELAGPLEVAALAASLTAIVGRHEALRTCFAVIDGEPVQMIAPPTPCPLQTVDLRSLAPSMGTAEIERLAVAATTRPFDLAAGPLFRALLVRRDASHHLLLFTLHHIVADGWSLGVLLRELEILYAAALRGGPARLPALPVQYADFACWQRGWLQGDVLAGQLAYWRQRLAGLPDLLDLPTDRPRPPLATFRGDTRPLCLDAAQVQELTALGRRCSSTVYMILLTAFSALLARYSGQRDLAVGSPIANRTQREIEPLIGFFVNTLVLRCELPDDPSFATLLTRVRASALDAYAHQELPFEQLVEDLAPRRSLRHGPLFQVLLALHNGPLFTIDLPDLEIHPFPVSSTVAKFDLSLLLEEEQAGGLAGLLEYNRDLFDGTTIERLGQHFHTLLAAALTGSERPVSTLPLLSAAEEAQLVARRPARPAGAVADGDAIGLHFTAQAHRTPHRVALTCGNSQLSYGALEAQSNQLAHHLRRLGVESEVAVGVCLGRSPRLLVALLGILKAGGAYVPLEPSLPHERLAFLAADARLPVVLTEAAKRRALPPLASQRVVCLDGEGEAIRQLRAEPPPAAAGGARLAYVIYTSGSTGQPKGVGVSHHNVLRLLATTAPCFGFGDEEVWTLFHSYAFDFSVWEMWGALLHGGRLVVVPHAVSRSPQQLGALLRRQGVTVLNQTPSAFRQLMEAETAVGERLRWVIFGGESLDVPSLERWFACHGDQHPRLVNMYGITETTVHVTFRPLSKGDLGSAGGSPVGAPLPDLSVFVLAPGLMPQPLGVPGEIHVGGAGPARGYLLRPALTAARYVPDPFAAAAGERLYCSGDLARWVAAAAGGVELEHLGRIDEQVQIRGFRVEPGEIAAVLASHAQVAQAVVVPHTAADGTIELIAYVVGQDARPEALRAHLRRVLPDYMLPAHFVHLPALPLTANGKLDRAALPAAVSPSSPEPSAGPRTAVEARLVAIWRQVLGREDIGVEDNFFDLGGHSLRMTRVLSRIHRALDVELSLRSFFGHPTVAGLAALIAGQRPSTLAPIPVQPSAASYGVSHAQRRLWVLWRMDPASATYNLPLVLELSGPLHTAALEQALLALVARHESLRTHFQMVAGTLQQVIGPASAFQLKHVDLEGLVAPARQASQLVAAAAVRPFDLQRGPLFRAQLVRLEADLHMLCVGMHHIVGDGWSLGVMARELMTLYAAFAAGRAPELPALRIQYRDYSAWQNAWLASPAAAAARAFWHQQLAPPLPVLELPLDGPRPAVKTYRGGCLRSRLGSAVATPFRQLCRAAGASLFMGLVAAVEALLGRYSGARELTVGAPVAARGHPELEDQIGFYVNVVVLRDRLHLGASFGSHLQRVRDTVTAAFEHQSYPFDRLVDELEVARDPSRSPLFEVLVVLQNQEMVEVSLPDLVVRPLAVRSAISKFELTFSFFEEGDDLHLALEYNTDLFAAARVGRAMGHLRRLMAAVGAAPDRPLAEIPLLSAAEQEQLVARQPERPAAAAADGDAIGLRFAAQAHRTPHRVAVTCGTAQLSYGALEARSNQLARYLRRLGVGSEVPVGVCLGRSPRLLVALLGILKAGGAYVPLEPSLPHERLAFLVADARLPVVLTEAARRGALPPLPGQRVVCLDGEGEAIRQLRAEPPPAAAGGARLAYVIYTSGSTGQPKGVGVSHHNVLRLLATTAPCFGFGDEEVWTLFHSYAFDFSVWEMWGALLHGGRLVVVPHAVSRSPQRLGALLRRQGVTVLNQTPSAFRQLMEAETAVGERLCWVIFGGESLAVSSLQSWIARRGVERPRLVNMYGITETTVHVSLRPLLAEDVGIAGGSPIGGPLPDLSVFVLAPGMLPQPLAVPGEIYVGGAGLARGYLRRPALTATRYVPNPFAAAVGERLYDSGDLARWVERAGGFELEHLGRIDEQVQIRGFRVEPGEIATALAAHARVTQAVVVPRTAADDTIELIAYVVGQDAAAETLRAHLRQSLPAYMLPAHFVHLPALPLTANGKLDRAALPPPASPSGGRSTGPRTAVEARLVAIWCEVLDREDIGVEDSFFDLGGHSLRMIRVLGRIHRELAVELPLRAFFDHPTVAELAALIAGEQRSTLAPIPVQAAAEHYAVSHAQRRMWVLWRMDPQAATYNLPLALELSGPLHAIALERALRALVARHESLRTTFAAVNGEPRQFIRPAAGFRLEHVDLIEEEAPAESARRAVAAEAATPFDLQHGPLFRARLLQLSAQQHVLCAGMHHIVGDGWSLGVLARELMALYVAFAAERAADLPALDIQYRDYAAWQNEWLSSPAAAAARSYWHQQLAPPLPVLELPLDGPRPAVKSFRGDLLRSCFPAAVAAPFRRLCRARGASLFMGLVAAVEALLWRYSGEGELIVGAPVAGRSHPQLEDQIGFYVNMLVLRDRLHDGLTFQQLLDNVRDTTTAAFEHQDYPFDRLVNELKVARDPSRSPLFEVLVVLQNQEIVPLSLPELVVRPLAVRPEISKFELSFAFFEDGEALQLALEYSTDLFAATRMRRLAGHLRRLLMAAVTTPDRPLAALSLLSAAERFQLLVAWNDTAAPYARQQSIVARFAVQARRFPERVASSCGPNQLTYGELARRAGLLARYLATQGIGRETPVALFLSRSPELVVGLLGVLTAGATYLPLDPDYPAARLRWMLADADAPLVLSTTALAASLPAGQTPVLCLDAAGPWVAATSPRALAAPMPDGVAYIMYTSGSTGQPKGVRVLHRGVVRLADHLRRIGFAAGERVLQLATTAFDASTLEIWGALLNGAELVAFRPGVPALTELGAFIRRQRLHTVFLTTALFQRLVDQQLDDLRGVRALLTGGDVMPVSQARRTVQELAGCQVFNCYGPTEGAVVATAYHLRLPLPAPVPIGQPLAHTRVHLLDRTLCPVPIGVPGELFLGEDCLARDYLRRPQETAASFIPDPFGQRPGGRLYRSGDRMRLLAEGGLDFLGRVDQQVKVRGLRIELGEIEAALAAHPAVGATTVVLRAAEPADQAAARGLVAYVVPAASADTAPSGGDLRRHLEGRLPSFMVPGAFVVLPALPVTAHGKVDRAALPAPPPRPEDVDRPFVAPDSALEQRIAVIWRQVLRGTNPGVHDNFFDLGGHSLAMIEAHALLEKELARQLVMVKLFEHPTIAALARYLEGQEERAASSEAPRHRATARRQALSRARRVRAGEPA